MVSGIFDSDWVRVPNNVAERYRNAGLWNAETLGTLTRSQARECPDSAAVVDMRHRWTYSRVNSEADALAAGLLREGLGPRDTVLVQLPNCAEFVAVLLALWRIGAVPVMGLPAHRLSELRSFADQARISAYVSAGSIDDFDQLDAADDLRRLRPDLLHIVVPGAGTPGEATPVDDAPGRVVYRDLTAATGTGAAPVLPDVDPYGPALLQLSGGSTGTPKLIPRTHADYLYSVRASVPVCGITADSVYLCALPCAHNFAMSSAGILGQLVAGGTVVMAPDPSPGTAFPLIRDEKVTVAGVVPPVALLWLAARARSRSADDPLTSLRVLQVGGARFSTEAARRVPTVLGCRLQQVFGMAEGLVNYTRLDDPDDIVFTTQGRPVSPADEIRIVDDNDDDVPDGEPGHLLARGPYTIRGYFRAPEHNARSFTDDGFYRTGDIVVRSANGDITVVGRAKDQINRGGEKIASEEVENHLLAHPGILEAAVVGEPDRLLGERVVAHLILQDNDRAADFAEEKPSALTRRTREFLAARGLATYKLPDRVVVTTELPRTAVGKMSTASLRGSGPDAR